MKENFAILTDAGGDFTREIIAKYGIEETPISTVVWPDGSERPTDLYWDTMTPNEYFTLMTNKKNNFGSSIPSPKTISDRLLDLAEEGRNVIVITISSKMSGGYSAFTVAAKEIMELHPHIKITVIDSLRYSGAIDLIAVEASLCREKGMSYEETVEYLQEFRLRIHQCGFIDDLFFLARKGRIAKGKAFMGNMIGLKPILEFDDKGSNIAVNKAIGRRKAYAKMAEMIKEHIEDPENQVIYLMHADCKKEDINAFKEAVLKEVKVKDIIIEPLGPIISASSGPGTIIINYRGK